MNPTFVNVLGKKYKILYVKKVDDEESSGSHHAGKLTIHISSELHADMQAETLLHEIIHAAEEQLDLEMTEKQVHGLSVGLFQVLRDNPILMKLLVGSKKRA